MVLLSCVVGERADLLCSVKRDARRRVVNVRLVLDSVTTMREGKLGYLELRRFSVWNTRIKNKILYFK